MVEPQKVVVISIFIMRFVLHSGQTKLSPLPFFFIDKIQILDMVNPPQREDNQLLSLELKSLDFWIGTQSSCRINMTRTSIVNLAIISVIFFNGILTVNPLKDFNEEEDRGYSDLEEDNVSLNQIKFT